MIICVNKSLRDFLSVTAVNVADRKHPSICQHGGYFRLWFNWSPDAELAKR